jgi:hypothetical protein
MVRLRSLVAAMAPAALLLFPPLLVATRAAESGPMGVPDGGSRCPNDCGVFSAPMRGRCSAALVSVCECVAPFSGPAPDCSERPCPAAPSWFDQPEDSKTAHTSVALCSHRGTCAHSDGTCRCEEGFEGDACERTVCPGTSRADGIACSGHGRCVTLRDAGWESQTLPGHADGWDAERIRGCICDAGWLGRACDEPQCPLGVDPLFRGAHEVQSITSAVLRPPTWREVQRIRIDVNAPVEALLGPTRGSGGPADIDEEQEVRLVAVGALPVGSFTLRLDCTPAAGGCILWDSERRVARTTGRIQLDPAGDAGVTADRIRAALEGLDIVGPGQVAVRGEYTEDTSAGTREFGFFITFTGERVPGDIPVMTLEASGVSAPGGAMLRTSIRDLVHGSDIRGVVQLSWDDAESYPSIATFHSAGCHDEEDDVRLAPQGVRTATWHMGDSDENVRRAIVGAVFPCPAGPNASFPSACPEVAPWDAITVERLYSGGPWVEYTVRFNSGVRARGDLAPLRVSGGTNISLVSRSVLFTSGNATVIVDEVQKGFFIAGNWTARVPFTDPDGAVAYGPQSDPPFLWCAGTETVRAALNAFDPVLATGFFGVTRTRAYPDDGQYNWHGEYKWRIVFQSVAGDQADLRALSDIRGNEGTPAALAVAEVDKGSTSASVSEVQILDCRCPAADCTFPASQGVRLTFRGRTTAHLPFSATADDIRAALRALPSIPDVLVRMYDAVSGTATSMCDADGTTTAVTFAWNGGPQPPLVVADAAHFSLPASASFALKRAPALGAYGGGRARVGTHRLLPCSGRGVCKDGACTCDAGYGPSDGALFPDASPGNATAGIPAPAVEVRLNCGRRLSQTPACPGGGACSGHGACSGAPDFVCDCDEGWTGVACDREAAECPAGPAWFDVPQRDPDQDQRTLAHRAVPCSGHGACGPSGSCTCDGEWQGRACELSPCPGARSVLPPSAAYTNATCANGAACVTLREYGRFYQRTPDTDAPVEDSGVDYSGWEADSLRGCACNARRLHVSPDANGYRVLAGHDCAAPACPVGEDPQDPVALDLIETRRACEEQAIRCTYGAGRLRLAFRGQWTRWLRWDAWVRDDQAPPDWMLEGFWTVESALRGLNTTIPFQLRSAVIQDSASPWLRLCDPNSTTTVHVTFTGSPGDMPLLVIEADDAATATGGTAEVTELVRGNLRAFECNRRGVCNRSGPLAGRCTCQPHYGSSDGAGAPGQVGDCGYKNPFWGLDRDLPAPAV